MASLLVKLLFWAQGMTNVDRRECERTVPMEVLVLGMSRTGTSSIRAALKQLGYNDTYHARCIYTENPRDADMRVEAYRAKYHNEGKKFTREEWDKLLGHCMAVTDVPCLHFKDDLITAYPHAKVILSIRDSPEAWLKSMRTTLIPFARRTYTSSFFSRLYALFCPRLPFQDMNDEMAKTSGDALQKSSQDRFYATDVSDYIEHNATVNRLAEEKGMQVLEFNVKQGWRPFCEFLGKPVPTDEMGEEMLFPRLNDSESFLKSVGMIWRTMNVLVAVNVGLTGLGCWGLWRGVRLGLERA